MQAHTILASSQDPPAYNSETTQMFATTTQVRQRYSLIETAGVQDE